jgi:hypothetical protein
MHPSWWAWGYEIGNEMLPWECEFDWRDSSWWPPNEVNEANGESEEHEEYVGMIYYSRR